MDGTIHFFPGKLCQVYRDAELPFQIDFFATCLEKIGTLRDNMEYWKVRSLKDGKVYKKILVNDHCEKVPFEMLQELIKKQNAQERTCQR
jgi:hypothetical protein